MSKVTVVKYNNSSKNQDLSQEEYRLLLKAGMRALSGEKQMSDALRKYIPPGVIGMKTNCLTGKFNSTPVTLTNAMIQYLTEAGFDENDLIVWERTNRELSSAGYTLNAASISYRCLGTDTNGTGYSYSFYNYGVVNSLVTRILTDMVDYNINLPVLKDHSIAGLSAGMKNMYGAIHNPNKYHDNHCDPFCAHVSNLTPIKSKNRLTILDAVKIQYNGGPGYVGKYITYYNSIIISDDPVAVDRIGLEILEQMRKIKGLPSLEKVGRPANYLKSAEQVGLGMADLNKIELNVINVDKDGRQTRGKLF